MKKLILLFMLLSGCATNGQYTINGIEPGENQTLKVVGSMVVLGIVAKAIAKPNTNYCSSKITNNNGQVIGTISTTKQTPC